MKNCPHTALRFWLMVWVLTLPLVHIHPEVDHAYGMSGHVHGGTYHSILVQTPVHAHQGYDQEEHHHDGFFAPEAHGESQQDPFHGFEEATYGFSVLKPTLDPEADKSDISQDLVTETIHALAYVAHPSGNAAAFECQHVSIPPLTLSPRAPPVLSI